jgi:hypothetical protein
VKLYNAGDYKGAIREFSAAQSLMPADLNNYNLALCYDKLGDAEPAIQYYKAYLDKVPNTDKRAEIEASVQRLDAALKSSAAKKAEEARKAEEAKKAIEAKKADDERKAAEDAKRKADEEAKRKADEDAKRKADEEAKPAKDPYGPDAPGPVAPPRGNPGVGTTGTPGTGRVQPTGDGQLDRVQNINIDQIRDERVGGSGSGIPTRQRPPARVGTGANGNVNVGGGVGGGGPAEAAPNGDEPRTAKDPRTAQAGPQTQTDPNAPPTDQPKPAVVPVYKKWWFWAVVAVSAYVVYSIASEDSKSSTAGRTMLPPLGTGGAQPHGGGFSLFRF